MTTVEDTLVYRTEALAFSDTPLNDLQDRSSLILETREITTECPVLVGKLTVEEGPVSMTVTNAYAQPGLNRIVFAPKPMYRHIAVHEIAHVVHHRLNTGGRQHGPQWRAVYVDMISITYGDHYGDLLRQAFTEVGLTLGFAGLPASGTPIIDIEALAAATQRSRWL